MITSIFPSLSSIGSNTISNTEGNCLYKLNLSFVKCNYILQYFNIIDGRFFNLVLDGTGREALATDAHGDTTGSTCQLAGQNGQGTRHDYTPSVNITRNLQTVLQLQIGHA